MRPNMIKLLPPDSGEDEPEDGAFAEPLEEDRDDS